MARRESLIQTGVIFRFFQFWVLLNGPFTVWTKSDHAHIRAASATTWRTLPTSLGDSPAARSGGLGRELFAMWIVTLPLCGWTRTWGPVVWISRGHGRASRRRIDGRRGSVWTVKWAPTVTTVLTSSLVLHVAPRSDGTSLAGSEPYERQMDGHSAPTHTGCTTECSEMRQNNRADLAGKRQRSTWSRKWKLPTSASRHPARADVEQKLRSASEKLKP